MKIYVDALAQTSGDGSKNHPFTTISAAAKIAEAGDEILVSPGIYREEVNPANAGKPGKRITYRSTKRLGATITGADIINTWTPYENSSDVYRVSIPNSYFHDFNPYIEVVYGDWFDSNFPIAHLGEVYLNGKSLYEVDCLDKVINPTVYDASWDPDFTLYTWYTCQDESKDNTVIYANFHGADPNSETVEINVRQHCFYPIKEHVGYITLDGFNVTKAATQWAPPTALQDGMIGPHWSKGWIIENCEVSHSKCSGISLGKYKQEGNDNKWTKTKIKDGSQTQRDCSCIAQLDGWSKDTIGSHIVRNCDIHDCGQTGIVGNLGCVFSLIENNHIHNINNKRNIGGAEIGGIKFHAAIDVIIRNNYFHDNVRGIWLDWQAQGTRVTGNLFHDNCMSRDHLPTEEHTVGLGLGEDLWIEIAHGPSLVDNNVFLSERAVKVPTQGCAFVHNLFGGAICAVGRGVNNGSSEAYASPRFTPVHVPHSTSIIGFATVLHGDMRFYNNVFVSQEVRESMKAICDPQKDTNEWDDGNLIVGTSCYSGYMKEETWKTYFEGNCAEGSASPRDRYYMPLPVWTGGNVFFNGAQPCDIEEDYTEIKEKVTLSLNIKAPFDIMNPSVFDWEIVSDYYKYLPKGKIINSDTLGEAYEPEERFEDPDGDTIFFNKDIFGTLRDGTAVAGPIEK